MPPTTAPPRVALLSEARTAAQACIKSAAAAADKEATSERQAAGRKAAPPPLDAAALLARLSLSPEYASMLTQREKLPAHSHRASLLAMASKHRVSLVLGAPGCGKSTQVPQLLFEDAASRQAPCRLLVAQPRRLAAVALAERVAAEMGEAVGGAVGYTIRGESKRSAGTVITFVTTGVLLRMLEDGAAALDGLTHVVLDEVHERTVSPPLHAQPSAQQLSTPRPRALACCALPVAPWTPFPRTASPPHSLPRPSSTSVCSRCAASSLLLLLLVGPRAAPLPPQLRRGWCSCRPRSTPRRCSSTSKAWAARWGAAAAAIHARHRSTL